MGDNVCHTAPIKSNGPVMLAQQCRKGIPYCFRTNTATFFHPGKDVGAGHLVGDQPTHQTAACAIICPQHIPIHCVKNPPRDTVGIRHTVVVAHSVSMCYEQGCGISAVSAIDFEVQIT